MFDNCEERTVCSIYGHQLDPSVNSERESVVINDKPKIHVSDPSMDDHAIIFLKNNMRIPLKLNVIFSYFETTTPSPDQVGDCEDVLLITPEHNWDPHTKVYASNEENIVDWEGNIKENQDRVRIMLEDID